MTRFGSTRTKLRELSASSGVEYADLSAGARRLNLIQLNTSLSCSVGAQMDFMRAFKSIRVMI